MHASALPPACLPACRSLPACPFACQSARLPVRLSLCQLFLQPACSHLLTFLPACLSETPSSLSFCNTLHSIKSHFFSAQSLGVWILLQGAAWN